MPVQESSATALVRLTGLAMICFNPDEQRGEIGIIRDDHNHTLTIKIQRAVYQDGAESDIVVYRDVLSYENLPRENVHVEIKAHGSPIAGYELYQNGEFNRLGNADRNDFRWLVDMERLHAGDTLNPTSRQQFPLTTVNIINGLFYTHKLARNLFFEKVEKDANGTEGRREIFGNVAETLGVKLDGREVSFTIRIGDREETHILQPINGLPFRIELKNMDYDANAVYSDMPDYYRYLASPNGNQFELKPISEDTVDETATGGSVNQEDFCHPIVFPVKSIAELRS